MNKFLTQKFSNLKLKSDSYTPLKEDADISESENNENLPKPSTPVSNGVLVLSSKKPLQNNKSFKIHKRSRHQKNKKDRRRNLFQEIQNKMQTLKTDIQAGLKNHQTGNKTPNCITPNRHIRHMLGRTPTKLYSPFSIETPPPSFHWRREFADEVQGTPVTNVGWQPSPKRNCAETRKTLHNTFI
ncbi:uncharacterized protein LOC135845603 [Planococcus citri]|uniref:uncharacterized protein LOC135845603 n=1 Tax=Planococcus citri TaxID=170843 RepID=UPI0031F7908E